MSHHDGQSVDWKRGNRVCGVSDSRSSSVIAMEDQEFNPAKLFVGGLGQQTTEASLSAYFSRFGTIKDSVVITDRATGRSRGFGFVVFESHASVDACLHGRHNVDGVSCEVRRAVPRDEARSTTTTGAAPLAPEQFGKVYVGGLSENCNEHKVRQYFSRFGPVRNVTLMYDRLSHRPRGFGFVVYDSPNDAQKAWGSHPELGRMVEAKKAEPRPDGRRGGGGDSPKLSRSNREPQQEWMPENAPPFYHEGTPAAWSDNFNQGKPYEPEQSTPYMPPESARNEYKPFDFQRNENSYQQPHRLVDSARTQDGMRGSDALRLSENARAQETARTHTSYQSGRNAAFSFEGSQGPSAGHIPASYDGAQSYKPDYNSNPVYKGAMPSNNDLVFKTHTSSSSFAPSSPSGKVEGGYKAPGFYKADSEYKADPLYKLDVSHPAEHGYKADALYNNSKTFKNDTVQHGNGAGFRADGSSKADGPSSKAQGSFKSDPYPTEASFKGNRPDSSYVDSGYPVGGYPGELSAQYKPDQYKPDLTAFDHANRSDRAPRTQIIGSSAIKSPAYKGDGSGARGNKSGPLRRDGRASRDPYGYPAGGDRFHPDYRAAESYNDEESCRSVSETYRADSFRACEAYDPYAHDSSRTATPSSPYDNSPSYLAPIHGYEYPPSFPTGQPAYPQSNFSADYDANAKANRPTRRTAPY